MVGKDKEDHPKTRKGNEPGLIAFFFVLLHGVISLKFLITNYESVGRRFESS
jgi:hypothetical protein